MSTPPARLCRPFRREAPFSCLGAMTKVPSSTSSSRPLSVCRAIVCFGAAGQRFFEALLLSIFPSSLPTIWKMRSTGRLRSRSRAIRSCFLLRVRRLTNSTPSNTAAAFSSSSSTFAPSTRDGVEQTLSRLNIHSEKRHDEPNRMRRQADARGVPADIMMPRILVVARFCLCS